MVYYYDSGTSQFTGIVIDFTHSCKRRWLIAFTGMFILSSLLLVAFTFTRLESSVFADDNLLCPMSYQQTLLAATSICSSDSAMTTGGHREANV